MSKNIYGLRDLTNEAVVEVIRRQFLLEADTNPQLYHPIDVDRCRTEDWQIERYLLEKGKPDEALKALVKAMKWKNSFGVHQRNGSYFPKELYEVFGFEKYSRDRQGHIFFWAAPQKYRKISEFNDLVRQFYVYNFDKMDRMVGNKGFISIGDAQVSLKNADLQLAILGTEVLEYYPQVFLKGYVVDLPGFLVALWKIVQKLLPQSIRDKAITIKRKELHEYVDMDDSEIPVSFGGSRQTEYWLSDEMLPLNQCKHLQFTDKQIDNFYQVYNFDKK